MGEQSLIVRGDLGRELGVTTFNTPPAPASHRARAAPTLDEKSHTARRAAAPSGTRGHRRTGPCLTRARSPGRAIFGKAFSMLQGLSVYCFALAVDTEARTCPQIEI